MPTSNNPIPSLKWLFDLERELAVESPPETHEKETEQDGRNRKCAAQRLLKIHN
jgi:hypothetical protein